MIKVLFCVFHSCSALPWPFAVLSTAPDNEVLEKKINFGGVFVVKDRVLQVPNFVVSALKTIPEQVRSTLGPIAEAKSKIRGCYQVVDLSNYEHKILFNAT